MSVQQTIPPSLEDETIPILKTVDLGKTVTNATESLIILTEVTFCIYSGETVAITGSSGSGKTTLLSLLAGLDRPTHGEIWLKGHSFNHAPEEQRAALRRQYLGFIFQSFLLLSGMSALENVMLPLELTGDAQAEARATHWLERVGLGARLKHQPHQLSGGEQQRVAIARAFVTQPALLLADEPTGNLDSVTAQSIMQLMFQLNQEVGTTLLLVTHDMSLAGQCARQIRLAGGRVVADSSSEASAQPTARLK